MRLKLTAFKEIWERAKRILYYLLPVHLQQQNICTVYGTEDKKEAQIGTA